MSTSHASDARTATATSAGTAASYLRVSTEEQNASGYSLPDQRRRNRQTAEDEGYAGVIEYDDGGYGGADPDRPGLARMLADADAGRINAVLVTDLDRLGRDDLHVRALLAQLADTGVRVYENGARVDLATPEGQLFTGIKSLFAAYERSKIRARTRAGIASRSQSKPWGNIAYGYGRTAPTKRDLDEGRRYGAGWEINPDEALVVRRIFSLLPSVTTYNGVAATLNREGVRPRTGALWTSTMIRNIVTRRHVLGDYHFGGEWYPDHHAPIIDRETWEAVQAIADRSRRWTPRGGGRLPARHVFIRGMLRCGLCGSAMLPRTEKRTGRETYECRTHKTVGAGACRMPILERRQVEQPVLAMFDAWALDLDATRAHLQAQLAERAAGTRAEAKRAAAEVARARAAADRCDRDYMDGRLSAASYERLSAMARDALAGAEAEHRRLREHADTIDATAHDADGEPAALRRLRDLGSAVAQRLADATGDVGALRTAVGAVFTHITVACTHTYAGIDGAAVAPIGDAGLCVVPNVRPEVIENYEEWFGGELAVMRRVALALSPDAAAGPPQDPAESTGEHTGPPAPGTHDDNQHGTFVWKYMTQKTLRPL